MTAVPYQAILASGAIQRRSLKWRAVVMPKRTLQEQWSGVSDGEKTKAKKTVVCSACRCQPGPGHPWDAFANVKGCKRGSPTGDKCRACVEQWQEAFLYLTWSEYASFSRTEASSWVWLGLVGSEGLWRFKFLWG